MPAAENGDPRAGLGSRHEGPCPVCGDGTADATRKLTSDGYPDWLVGCFSASCRALEGSYLGELAEALGLSRGVPKSEIAAAFIASGTTARRGDGGRESKPTDAALAGWRAQLAADAGGLAYLHERGLTDETIRLAGIGYGQFHGRPRAFMFPVRNALGGLLTLKERYWPELWADAAGRPHKSRTLAGRGSHLFPALGDGRHVVLCEGEMDALVTAQAIGACVEVVTATSGASLRDGLCEEFAGRRVAVVYDVGAEELSERTAARLREAGAGAWAVALDLPNKGDDLNDWFRYGRAAGELLELIREAA